MPAAGVCRAVPGSLVRLSVGGDRPGRQEVGGKEDDDKGGRGKR